MGPAIPAWNAWAICVALDVPVLRLVDPPGRTQVIRAHESDVAAAEADYLATLLAACRRVRAATSTGSGRAGTPASVEPHNTGVVDVVIGAGAGREVSEPVELASGDYIRYPGDVAHVFEALEPGTLAVLLSEHV